jgi:MYXO-CTERM domain-containing protein
VDLNSFWKPSFGVNAGGDADGDGDTDGGDFLIWQRELGANLSPAAASAAAVPEPGCGLLAAIVVLAAPVRRRRS